jgi:hypothetical protein
MARTSHSAKPPALSYYEVERNKLTDQAEAYADRVAGPEPERRSHYHGSEPTWGAKWNRAYHGEMARLVRERFGTTT